MDRGGGFTGFVEWTGLGTLWMNGYEFRTKNLSLYIIECEFSLVDDGSFGFAGPIVFFVEAGEADIRFVFLWILL